MSDLLHRIAGVITEFDIIIGHSSIVVAVSGGSDSISLLHILSRLFPNNKRIAVYIDHCLRPNESQAERALVKEQAAQCKASFLSVVVDVPSYQKDTHCSLEDAARRLRYDALEEVRAKNKATIIVLGHTADDQAEELLLRLIRGSGSNGLSGMAPQNGYLIRPLLQETKEELRLFLKANNIPFCTDSSNHNPRFTRNRIRLELLPQLKKHFNPSIRETLLQTANILKAEDALLETLTLGHYQELVRHSIHGLTLALPDFTEEPLAIQRRIIEKICWKFNSQPSFSKIENIHQLCHKETGKELHLSDGLRAIRQRNTLLFTRPSSQKGYRGPGVPPLSFPPLSLPSPGVYSVPTLKRRLRITSRPNLEILPSPPGVLVIDAADITFPLTLRLPVAGEKFYPLGAPGRKKVARFLSDHKISAAEKYDYPVLLNKDMIVALLGLQISHPFRITPKTQQVLHLYWQSL